MEDEKLFNELKDNIDKIKIFDTHEHIISEKEWRKGEIDFFFFFGCYTRTDLISSGLKEEDFEKLFDPSLDIKKKWEIFNPYWEYIKNTTYSKVILSALKDLYGIEEINIKAIEIVSEKMNKLKEVDHYSDILKKRCNIEFILIDRDTFNQFGFMKNNEDYEYFLPVLRLDEIFQISSKDHISKLEKASDTNISDFKDFINLIDKVFEIRKDNIHALKIGTAYTRDLLFDDVSYGEAEISFLKILRLNCYNQFSYGISMEEMRPFQDFMHHYLIKKAIEYSLPIQIHTGLLEGNGNDIRNSNPTHLTKLVLKYKNAKFDIFHIGYPYFHELTAMIKMYPNCYINFCWIAEVSENLYKNAMDLLIDMIPSNKIFGFGGDYLFVEGTYGAQKIARRIIADVLYERIKNNYFSIEEALKFAERILNTNAKKIYLK